MQKITSFCFICGRTKPVSVIYNKDSICIIRCLECQTLFRPKEEHCIINPNTNVADYYNESIRCVSGNRLFFRLTFEELIKKFPHIKNGNFLDLGCGIGNSLLEARQLGFNVFAIESSKWAIEHCIQFGFEVSSSLEELDKKRIKFDIINLNHVLEHISNPIDLINKLKERLKKDGILRIEVPNCSRYFFWKFALNLRCKYIVTTLNPDHIYYYNIKTLKNIILKTDLEIIDIYTEGFGNFIRHKATMLNPNILVKILSAFLYLTGIEKKLNLESFLIVIAKKKEERFFPLTNF